MSSVTLVSAEAFAAMDGLAELVRGEVVPMSPASNRHGRIEANLIAALHAQVRGHRLGRLYTGDTGFWVEDDPDSVLCPDVAFVSFARMPEEPEQGFARVVPDLVVEVASPSDTAEALDHRAERWLALGARLAWVVLPRTRKVLIYRPGRPLEAVSGDLALDGGEVLPGLSVPLADVFQ